MKATVHTKKYGELTAFYRLTSKANKIHWEKEKSTQIVQVSGQLMPYLAATNRYEFDNQRFRRIKHQTHYLVIEKFDQRRFVQTGFHPIHLTHQYRKRLIKYAQKLPEPSSAYLQSIMLGEVPDDFYQQYRGLQRLGLIHLFSISGFQVAFVLERLGRLMRRCHLRYEVGLLINTLIIPFYYVFAGSIGSLLRPMLAAEIKAGFQFRNRRVSQACLWSLSLLAGLWLMPRILLSVGGVLSYGLSGALLLTEQLPLIKKQIALSTLSAPVVINQTFQWHLLSGLINLAIIPVFSWLIMPLLLLLCLPTIGLSLAPVINCIIQLIANSIELFARLPGNLTIGAIPTSLCILITLCCWLGLTQQHWRNGYLKTAVIVLVGLTLFYRVNPIGEVTWFDIGQGDATLIRRPFSNKVGLIDTGGKLDFTRQAWQKRADLRVGERMIAHYIRARSMNQIVQLILTHQDQDHIGHAANLARTIKIKEIVIPSGMEKSKGFQTKILPIAQSKQIKIKRVLAGANLLNQLELVYPQHVGKGTNEDSLAVVSRVGRLNFLTAGDLDRAGERAIANRYPKLQIDLLKFGHHGSKTSSDPKTLKHWQVKYGVVSAGRNNRYGHPNRETLATSHRQHMIVYNTQQHGMINYRFGLFSFWTTQLSADATSRMGYDK